MWMADHFHSSERAISKVSNQRGSTILVKRPVSLAHQSSFHPPNKMYELLEEEEEEQEEQYCSVQSPIYQNHVLGEMDGVDNSTVPGTFPERPRPDFFSGTVEHNESQISSLGRTPRWQVPSSHLEMGRCIPPSQVEFRSTTPKSFENSRKAPGSHRNSDTVHSSSHSGMPQSQSENSPPDSTASDRDPSQTTTTNLLALCGSARSDVLRNITNVGDTTDGQPSVANPEWDGCNPDLL